MGYIATEEKHEEIQDQPEPQIRGSENQRHLRMPTFCVAGKETQMVGHDAELLMLQNMSFAVTKVDVKQKLSALWVALMFLYTYEDILGFYTPGIIEGLISGEAGGMQITEAFLFVMAVWMAIPSLMVLLSLTLKAHINRWVNLTVAIISVVALAATFFIGEISFRYAFHAAVEGVLIALILWQAWRWPLQEKAKVVR